jgi:hypothetical protein
LFLHVLVLLPTVSHCVFGRGLAWGMGSSKTGSAFGKGKKTTSRKRKQKATDRLVFFFCPLRSFSAWAMRFGGSTQGGAALGPGPFFRLPGRGGHLGGPSTKWGGRVRPVGHTSGSALKLQPAPPEPPWCVQVIGYVFNSNFQAFLVTSGAPWRLSGGTSDVLRSMWFPCSCGLGLRCPALLSHPRSHLPVGARSRWVLWSGSCLVSPAAPNRQYPVVRRQNPHEANRSFRS